MIQRRLAWPLCKDDTHTPEVFHIFKKSNIQRTMYTEYLLWLEEG